MNQLAIGFLNGFGLPPSEFVDLTADAGCRYMSIVVQGAALVPLGYPPYSLKDDPVLKRELLAAMSHRGVAISLGDGFLVLPGTEISSFAVDLDVLAELGVPAASASRFAAARSFPSNSQMANWLYTSARKPGTVDLSAFMRRAAKASPGLPVR